ncbi:MAG: polysaccharide biosynthesis protein [Gammaproteobacteria bacterium]
MARTKKNRRNRTTERNRHKVVYSAPQNDTLVDDLDPESDDFEIDFQLSNDIGPTKSETPIDFSVSKELVRLTGEPARGDSTIGRHLAKMSDFEFLDPEKLQEKRIIHPDMENYEIINSFREIRTRLLQLSGNKNFVLMVTAINRHMGATFTTVNLGAAFSFEGEKTSLLIDCHPQENNLGKLLDLEQSIGLSDYINNPEIELNRIIYQTGINRMRLVPFGSSRAGRLEFLASERMREFIRVLKNRYSDRFVILNAPPLEVSADAAILSEIADYVLVVFPYGKVSNSRIKRAIKSLPREKIAGMVMNDCKKYF